MNVQMVRERKRYYKRKTKACMSLKCCAEIPGKVQMEICCCGRLEVKMEMNGGRKTLQKKEEGLSVTGRREVVVQVRFR